MSKFLKVMIVLLTIAAMAAPAFAEDRLGLGGQMRVRGWSLDNGTDTKTFADQRLRIGGKFSIAEGVSVTFRTDVTENAWGAGGNEFGSGRNPDNTANTTTAAYDNTKTGTMQWDRAHLDLDMGNFHLRAGQQLVTFGLGETMNAQEGGLRLDIKGPVSVSAFWMLDDQNGGTATSDSYFFGANVGHKTDAYSGNVFAGGQTKTNATRDDKVYLLGADFGMKLSAVNLKAELDFFFGDATATTDAMGAQLFVDVSMAPADAITVGAQGYYALAADAGEKQYQFIGNDFDGYDPIMDLGTNLHNEQMPLGRPFDFTGKSAGVIGARLYAGFKASDSVNLGASLAYLIPEDDNLTTRDSDLAFAGAVTYKVMANTSLQAQVQYVAKDDTNNAVEDDTQVGAGLYVNF